MNVEKSSPCYLEKEAHNKPQSRFQHVLAHNSYNQFKHLGDFENVHPYKEEIEELLKNLNTEFVNLFDGNVTKIEDTECVWVETTSQLEELVEVLSKEGVFGVDTEQHTYRSFLGFTALIQISTTSKDYLVDAIALHDVMGILRPVFANPRICKVFHGARNDILWLQRDFHIYVVNLFDTAKASELLWADPKSFASLVEKYFKVSKNKALTRGDWTARPLSGEMVEYARIDSHYLLPVANRIVMELKNNSIDLVLKNIRRSNEACLQLYRKKTTETYLGESAAESIIACYFNNNQARFQCDAKLRKLQRCVRRLCGWREIMARVHDESLRFILSDQAIIAIAATLPTTEADVYGTICRADNSRSPSLLVCSHFKDFCMLLFPDNATEDEDENLGHTIVQMCVGSNGNCPLSSYNYNLLSNTIPKLSKRLVRADDQKKRPVIMPYPKPQVSDICVGCGEGNSYDRYRIIPHCYLRWFPVHLKEVQEVVTVCVHCHKTLNDAAMECKREIDREFGIPLAEEFGSACRAVMSLLRACKMPGSKCPPNRLEEFKKEVSVYYGGREVTIEDLQQAALVGLSARMQRRRRLEVQQLLTAHVLARLQNIGISHSNQQFDDDEIESNSLFGLTRRVVDSILRSKGEDGILQFCQRWRQVFTNAIH